MTVLTFGLEQTGTTTGISAHDRALTAFKLSDPASVADDFNRPGHMVPLRAVNGGVLTRKGHTEASVGELLSHLVSFFDFSTDEILRLMQLPCAYLPLDLCTLAGLRPAGLICELVKPDCELGSMARRDDCFQLARDFGLKMISIEQLAEYRRQH